jgi:hypothetical protein
MQDRQAGIKSVIQNFLLKAQSSRFKGKAVALSFQLSALSVASSNFGFRFYWSGYGQ